MELSPLNFEMRFISCQCTGDKGKSAWNGASTFFLANQLLLEQIFLTGLSLWIRQKARLHSVRNWQASGRVFPNISKRLREAFSSARQGRGCPEAQMSALWTAPHKAERRGLAVGRTDGCPSHGRLLPLPHPWCACPARQDNTWED